ncbi:ABC transporter transmembrane region domain-containing protein [Rhizoctonia solani AG-1 IA]|uniref:ABC transporter transmembrane region domain-containing protein n=1 Tax=Thanatephorus cucumeris (strain AG1-IA) TaxID=983506 RepID=L8WHM8_THACA|nr:ABC transporter transmembrane region domain-containing protein [Rhizoctonia solani AG-1 IA]
MAHYRTNSRTWFNERSSCSHVSSESSRLRYPIFALPGATVFAIGLMLGRVYIAAQMPVKREMSNARSPLFSHFGTTLEGITSIRAYGVEELFKAEALKRIDKYTRSYRTFWSLNVSKAKSWIFTGPGLSV